MEHPEVPFWSRTRRYACDPLVPHMCDHVISSFATSELRELSSMPHVFDIVFDQCMFGKASKKPT
eukprot:10494639-Karenia_brevis.AAC.1